MDKLKEAILKKCFEADGKTKLACSSAFSIAQELDVKVSEIGDICNEENIRICNCQLKCFD